MYTIIVGKCVKCQNLSLAPLPHHHHHHQVLSTSLIFSVLYVWCRINKTTIVQFWFGVQVAVNILLEY